MTSLQDLPSFQDLPKAELEAMWEAGQEVLECYRLLQKTKENVVGEVLKGQGEFFEWDHYPKGDVYDFETHSQYYYHAHPVDLRSGEHGHFHTFLRPKGFPSGILPADVPDYEDPPVENDALSHLIAISMNPAGFPIRLFTTNRWVTGEVWYEADDVCRLLDYFHMDQAWPSLPVNIWITNMVRLFRPQIEQLLHQRDEAVQIWAKERPEELVYEDRDLEITSFLDVSVDEQVEAIASALNSRA